jgi:hypothetical protein
MAKEAAGKDKDKSAKPGKQAKSAKPEKQAQLGEDKSKAKKAAKPAEKAAEKVAEAPKEEKPKPTPRPPADLRLKVLKKFYGKFLPRGPLRDRHRSLMARWNSGADHGGVTVEELKSLYEDWKAARAKPPRKVAVAR